MASTSIATKGTKDQLTALPGLKPIQRKKRNRAAAPDAPCYVYFIENRSSGHVKVGRTVKLDARIAAVKDAQGTAPGQRAYWGWIRVARDLGSKVEAALHKEWADVRHDGEWFDLRAKQVAEDARRVAQSICGAEFNIAGLGQDADEPQERWTEPVAGLYKAGGIAGPRMG